jgi:hypothetical protein
MAKKQIVVGSILAALLAGVLPAVAQGKPAGAQVQTVVTVMPKGEKNGEGPVVDQSAIQVKADNKPAQVTDWIPLRGDRAGLQLMVLVDESARSNLALQISSIQKFFAALPPTTQVGVAYMQNGRAVVAQAPTSDHGLAAKALRITNGFPGQNGSPYFCVQDLVKRWPAANNGSRREVLMISDGVDEYYGRNDPEDPYLQASISDAQKAGVLVYSIYFRDAGRWSRSGYETFAGQNKLLILSQATGAKSYYQGFGSPVSLDPFLDDLRTTLNNQYELGFTAEARNKSSLQQLKVKATVPHTSVQAPERVLVGSNEAE